jgi:hypothetical protein
LVHLRGLGYGENDTPRENQTGSLQSNSKKDLKAPVSIGLTQKEKCSLPDVIICY